MIIKLIVNTLVARRRLKWGKIPYSSSLTDKEWFIIESLRPDKKKTLTANLEQKTEIGWNILSTQKSLSLLEISNGFYRLRHKPKQQPGQPPTVPVAYIQIPQECGAKELFGVILEHLKYQVVKGTIAEIRDRTMRVLKGCGVEMLIIDEADRFKPKTFAEVRDIFDKLEIPVILVGTDRLDAVIKRDEQVYNRFRSSHRFGKLSGEEFKRTVKVWEKKVLQLPVASNLSSKAMLKALGEATGGYVGL